MRYLPMRRSRLVGTEGPGSLVISPEGETSVVGALDFWFKDFNGNAAENKEEFKVIEPRLQAILKVDAFYQPPEFREQKINDKEQIANSNLVTPLMRFPQWHYCGSCKTLRKFELDATNIYVECKKCEQKRYFKQVPFVTVCEHGHLSDFPWVEWTHGNENAKCNEKIRIQMSGGTTLDSWLLVCDCGKRRTLKGVTTTYKSDRAGSALGDQLNDSSSKKYTCSGHKPWCGEVYEECEAPPVAILRNSINVYMAKKISAISIPGDHNENVEKIVFNLRLQSKYLVRENLGRLKEMKDKIEFIRTNMRHDLKPDTTDADIEMALVYLSSADTIEFDENEKERPEKTLRKKEFEKLVEGCVNDTLKVIPEWEYETFDEEEDKAYKHYTSHLQRFSKVLRLKETIALYGFDRKDYDTNNYHFESYYPRLFKEYSAGKLKWLPVNEVYGEGIFLQLNLEKIEQWEAKPRVQEYFMKYLARIKDVEHRDLEILQPRNLMLHTLSHFLIDEFANISGYNRAAIRERLYLEENQAGVLIYTSAGDSEGTLGGLVRLGTKAKFFSLLDLAINRAEWCSSDPVCTELGESFGQGIKNLNGAACYNCSHIPETSCELWNQYLDRRLLIDEEVGFFKIL